MSTASPQPIFNETSETKMKSLFAFGKSLSVNSSSIEAIKNSIKNIEVGGFVNVYGIYESKEEASSKGGIQGSLIKSFISKNKLEYKVQGRGGNLGDGTSYFFIRVTNPNYKSRQKGRSELATEIEVRQRLNQIISIAKEVELEETPSSTVIEGKVADVDLVYNLAREKCNIEPTGKPFNPSGEPTSAHEDCSVFVSIK